MESQSADKEEPSTKEEAKEADQEDKKSDEKEEKKAEKPPKPVAIDLAEFERRAVVLPPTNGYFEDISAVSGKLIYRRRPHAGASDEKSTLVYYDLDKREDKTILDDVDEAHPRCQRREDPSPTQDGLCHHRAQGGPEIREEAAAQLARNRH